MAYIVNVHGACDNGSGEVAVVDEGYTHGLLSYGWCDNRKKILIASSGGPCQDKYLPSIWEAHIALAYKVADDLNSGKLVLPSEEDTPPAGRPEPPHKSFRTDPSDLGCEEWQRITADIAVDGQQSELEDR